VPRTSPEKWSLIERLRASYYPGRSGDLLVVLKREITPISDTSRYIATHGSAWDYDRRVPILFWRKGIAPSASDAVVETTDIMPTLAEMVGLPLTPGSIDGRCLSAVVQCPAGAANR
jgi:predicted AlkP superfamily pyrophosphatase or phosphodiesterase